MSLAIIFLFTPLFVGIIATLLVQPKRRIEHFLFHHIYEEERMPHNLSEIPQSQFDTFCQLAKEEAQTNESVKFCFDDGLKSNYSVALPILEKHNLKASFFIPTAHLTNMKTIDVYGEKERLKENEILKLAEKGHTIGSHTVTHRSLLLLDDKHLRDELYESKRSLEAICKKEVTALSFPYGLWNNRVIKIAKEIGYTTFYAYNNHERIKNVNEIYPVMGVYPFDSNNDMREKIKNNKRNYAIARALITPHFAKGSQLAVVDKSYNYLRLIISGRFFKKNSSSNKKEGQGAKS